MKYALHPAMVFSKNDGEMHYVDAPTLAGLYKVSMDKCIVWDGNDPATFRGRDSADYIHLYPMRDGNYSLPTKVERSGG